MPTGAEIKIDTAKMAAVAQVISNQTSIIKNCFDSIREQSSRLQGECWEGESADAYFSNMKKLCSQQALSGAITTGYVVSALEEYTLDLNKAAMEYNSTERNLDSLHKALPTDVFGI
ncbi:MAG: WXG100 family type VII secretion target [Oscillospiraceae bacterium]|nr:WXG100 family type VII secretion target [Oscillospiraceae bacterium]